MEDEAQKLVATLKRSSVTVDQKVQAFNSIKSNIKHLRVPDAAQPTIFECIRIAISSSQSPALATIAYSTLGHLIKRLSLQQQNNVIVAQSKKMLPLLLEKLGDNRESFRNAASQNLADFYPFAHEQVENTIKDGALAGHSPRAKETAMMWVLKMHKTEGLPFKSYVPQLVACLEDADGMVRETAKSTIVELFRNAPDHAKTDLKKRLKLQDVRHTIATHITSQLDMRPSVEHDLAASTMSIQTMPDLSHHDSTFGESAISEIPPAQDAAPMEPSYVSTQRELEDIFKDMQVLFEGKETEHNWVARDKSVTKLRRLLKGNAFTDFNSAFVAGIRSVMDGVNRISNSLRTTVSSNGCQLVQELAKALGSALDPVAEMCIQNFIKMSASTKQIAANNGNDTVQVLLSHVSYNKRLLEHTWFSFQEKNVQIRTFATGWLRSIIKKHASHKSHIEHSGGLELAEKCIKKGLGDANPKVREGTRAAYWAFSLVWPDSAEKIMDSLDAKSRSQLEKDSNNPNAASMASSVSSIGGASKARPGTRPSIKDAIAAQRRAALAAKNMPERPTSAQSHFSPTKTTTPSVMGGRPVAARAAAARPPSALAREASGATQSSQSSTGGSLMAAPVRRPRRPEIARPATADPYAASRRTGLSQHTPTMSPNTSPQKSKSTAKAPARTPGRAVAPTAASTQRTKSRMETAIPRKTPRRSTTGTTDSPLSSPSRGDDLTLVVPFTKPPDSDEVFAAPNRRPAPASVDSSTVEDEGFTMVLPHHYPARPGSSGRPGSSSSQSKIATPRFSPGKAASASPLNVSHLRSPSARSPERMRNTLPGSAITAESEPVQVYEDPFTSDRASHAEAGADENEKPVLEELPIEGANERLPSEETAPSLGQSTRSNEQNIDVQRTPRHHKTTSTGSVIAANGNTGSETTAELVQSRRIISSGIQRIKNKTLDAHSFRKLQEIIKNSGSEIWGDEGQRYSELLLAMLEYLEAPNETLKPVSGSGSSVTKAQNLKGQVLATIRAMLTLHKREASAYYSTSLVSVITSRRQWDESMHITADIEKTADEIIKYANTLEALDAVLDLLEHLGAVPGSPTSSSSSERSPISHINEGYESHRTASFALNVLGSLLTAASARNLPVDSELSHRLGGCAVKYLQDSDSDVRKADLDFLLVMHEKLGGGENAEEFWRVLRNTGVKEQSVNLIMFYIAKSRRGRV